MKTLKKIIDEGLVDDVKVDPAIDKRYGNKPLFQCKIDRIRQLVKKTPLEAKSK